MKSRHASTLPVTIVCILCVAMLCSSCSQSRMASNSDDPRMAGFKGKISKNYADSKEDWPTRPKAPDGSPNVLVILLDDVGFGQLGPYGGLTHTPNIDKLAARGLTYTNFHSPALCSPSRAAILAGRNHHSIGFGSHAATAMGFPGYNGFVPPQAASGAKILQQNGFTTYALGNVRGVAQRPCPRLAEHKGPARPPNQVHARYHRLGRDL